MIVIFILTILFTAYNIYYYLWKQSRYKTWLVSFFYILATIVLSARLTQYFFSVYLNNIIYDKMELAKTDPEEFRNSNFTSLVHNYRKIAQC